MRTIPFSLTARGLHAAITITQPNAILRVTTAPDDVIIGGQTFTAMSGANITNMQFSGDGTASNADIRIMASPAGPVTPGMGARGLLDGLNIKVEIFDPDHIALGTFDMMPGATIGSVAEDTNNAIIFAVQGRLALMQSPMTEVHTVVCKARLGDHRCRVPLDVPDVARSTQYYVKDTKSGDRAAASDTWVRKAESGSYHDLVYECTTAGVTAGSAPTYPTSIGATVTDGTAVFTARQAWLVAATGGAIDFFNIQLDATPSSEPTTLGNIIPRTGPLKDTKIQIAAYDSGTQIVTTWEPFAPSNFPPGTVFEMHRGCDRLMSTCKDIFNNIRNLRGVPYAPNSDLQTGRA